MTARFKFLLVVIVIILLLAVAGGLSLASGDSRSFLRDYLNLATDDFSNSPGGTGLPVSLMEGLKGKKGQALKGQGATFDEKIAGIIANRKKAVNSNAARGNWPLKTTSSRVTSLFNEDRGYRKHAGIDIGVPVNTPVVAVFAGKFYKGDEGESTGLGKYVWLVHDNGLVTYYGHLNRWAAIGDGKEVSAGTIIGWSGNSGKSTGPHLHFAVKAREGFIDPLPLLKNPEIINKNGKLKAAK